MIKEILQSLEKSPSFLLELLEQIPLHRYRERRVEGKWCIHEQVCHLVDSQHILLGRFRQFRDEANPHIKAHTPQVGRDRDHYMNMDMKRCLDEFPIIRGEMLQMLKDQPDHYWSISGSHEAFEPYNTKILLMHTLNVDHTHFFSIEQLGLTLDGLEGEIMVLP